MEPILPDVPEGDWGQHPNAGTEARQCRDIKTVLSVQQELSPVKITEDHVLSMLSVRRAREAVMGRELFSDPAWDILLELYAAHLGGREMTLTECARSIGTPESTTARWISVLTDRQLVTAVPRAGETVQLSIKLSSAGEAAMKRLVDYWGSAFRSI